MVVVGGSNWGKLPKMGRLGLEHNGLLLHMEKERLCRCRLRMATMGPTRDGGDDDLGWQ